MSAVISTRTGDLKTPIDVLAKSTTGTGGFKSGKYSTILSAKCQWVNAHGSDQSIAGAEQVALMATVTMRYSPLVTEDCRIAKGGRTFEIISGIDNVRERNRWIQFKVRAVVNA